MNFFYNETIKQTRTARGVEILQEGYAEDLKELENDMSKVYSKYLKRRNQGQAVPLAEGVDFAHAGKILATAVEMRKKFGNEVLFETETQLFERFNDYLKRITAPEGSLGLEKLSLKDNSQRINQRLTQMRYGKQSTRRVGKILRDISEEIARNGEANLEVDADNMTLFSLVCSKHFDWTTAQASADSVQLNVYHLRP